MPARNKEKLELVAQKISRFPANTPEYKNWMQRLDKAAKHGNQEAKYTLDKTMEYSARNRKDYKGLQEFITSIPFGVSGFTGFVGSRIGEEAGGENHKVAGNIIGGLLGGLIGASHDIINIGRSVKYPRAVNKYKNFVEYDAGVVKYSDEPVKVNDKISYLAERLKTGAAERTGIEENFNTIPYLYEDNPYLHLNKFNETEKVWDFVQNYTPAKILSYRGPAVSNYAQKLIVIKDPITNKNVNIPLNYPININGKLTRLNPKVKYDDTVISDESVRNIVYHELYHIIEKNRWTTHEIPQININEFLRADDDFAKMLAQDHGDELAARIVQIKNHSKINDGWKQFTGEEYKKMFEKYLEDGQPDNNMQDLYNIIKDWDKFAKWANRIVPGLSPFFINKNDK